MKQSRLNHGNQTITYWVAGLTGAGPSVPFACVILLTLALSFVLAQRFFFNFNPDSIALLQLAHYWWHGQWNLATSSYWGPLLPILMSPLIGVGVDPLLSARFAMAGTAVVYLLGARSLLKALGLSGYPLEWCSFLVGVTCALYSAMAPTADLLMSGLVCFGLAHLLGPNWAVSRAHQLSGGTLLGLAYLAKAVALPLSVLLIFAVAMLISCSRWAQRGQVATASAATILALTLVAGPWIAVLSIKFDKFMFASTGSLAYAIAGPPDVDRYHPVGNTFHIPPNGRNFAWEDPIGMPYKFWSPFERPEYMEHQLLLIMRNARYIFNVLGSGLLAFALFALVLVRPWRTGHRALWAWALPLVVLLSCLYLPMVAGFARYYLLSFPVLFASGAMVMMELGKRVGLPGNAVLFLMITVSGLLAAVHQIRPAWWELHWIDADYGFAMRQALPLARQLQDANESAEVASIGDEFRVGMYIAYMLDSRWRGNRRDPTLEEVKQSGAQLIVVDSDRPLLRQIATDPDMREQIAPPPLAGVQPKWGRMRYYWYKKPKAGNKAEEE